MFQRDRPSNVRTPILQQSSEYSYSPHPITFRRVFTLVASAGVRTPAAFRRFRLKARWARFLYRGLRWVRRRTLARFASRPGGNPQPATPLASRRASWKGIEPERFQKI